MINSHNLALVRGVLKRDGSRLVCEVTELKPVAGDLERLERGLSSLAAKDFETRKSPARSASAGPATSRTNHCCTAPATLRRTPCESKPT